jgi:hypothetical protein
MLTQTLYREYAPGKFKKEILTQTKEEFKAEIGSFSSRFGTKDKEIVWLNSAKVKLWNEVSRTVGICQMCTQLGIYPKMFRDALAEKRCSALMHDKIQDFIQSC